MSSYDYTIEYFNTETRIRQANHSYWVVEVSSERTVTGWLVQGEWSTRLDAARDAEMFVAGAISPAH